MENFVVSHALEVLKEREGGATSSRRGRQVDVILLKREGAKGEGLKILARAKLQTVEHLRWGRTPLSAAHQDRRHYHVQSLFLTEYV